MRKKEEAKYDKTQKISIDVIIPTYNAGGKIKELIESLAKQVIKDKLLELKVVIVDSGTYDGSLDFLKNYDNIPVSIIEIENKDFYHSYARNLGAQQADADYLLFMTQDAIPEDDKWLSKMIEPLGRGYVAVSCAEDTTDCSDLFYKIGSHFIRKR